MCNYPYPLEKLEKAIGYTFKNKSIITVALTHSSYANEQKMHSHKKKAECNERLEFLGDSVLSFITSRFIYEKFADQPEGFLTKTRAAVVCSKSLANLANKIGLGNYLLLGKGEEDTGRTNPKILENAFEALLAAIYLDSSYSIDTVAKFLMPIIEPEIHDASKNSISFDYKTALQQFVQSVGKDRLQYICVGESGPDHNKTFEVEAKLNSNIVGRGIGKTKREAEQNAAKEALELFAVK